MNNKFFVTRVIICWILLTVLGLFSFTFVFGIAGLASDFADNFVGKIPFIGSAICGGLFLTIFGALASISHYVISFVCFLIARDEESIYYKALFGAGFIFLIIGLYGFTGILTKLFSIALVFYGVYYMITGYNADK